jgi:hypothetical protein
MPGAEVRVTNASDEKGTAFVRYGYAEVRSADGSAFFGRMVMPGAGVSGVCRG